MNELRPYSDEELKKFWDEWEGDNEIPLSRARFLFTLAARDKRIEELTEANRNLKSNLDDYKLMTKQRNETGIALYAELAEETKRALKAEGELQELQYTLDHLNEPIGELKSKLAEAVGLMGRCRTAIEEAIPHYEEMHKELYDDMKPGDRDTAYNCLEALRNCRRAIDAFLPSRRQGKEKPTP